MDFIRNNKILNRKFSMVFWPTLMLAAINSIYTFADSVIISRLCGADRLAGVQMASPLTYLLSLIYWILGIGGSLLCFESKADNNEKDGNAYFSTVLVSIIASGFILTAGYYLFKNQILSVLCSNVEIREYTAAYLDTYTWAFIPISYSMGISYFIRNDGYPYLPFISLLVGNNVVILMDFVLIRCCHMDIEGAGLASLIGYLVSSIIISSYFFLKNRTLQFQLSLFPGGLFHRVFRAICHGFPASSVQFYMIIKNWVLNSIISVMGTEVIICYSLYNYSIIIPCMFYVGLSQTMTPFASFYNQNRDYSMLRALAKKSFSIVFWTSMVCTAIVAVKPEVLSALFQVAQAGSFMNEALRILAFSYIGEGLIFVLTFYLQAINKLRISSIISILDGFAVEIVLVYLGSKTIGIYGLPIGITLSSIVILVLYILYAYKKFGSPLIVPKIDDDVVAAMSVMNGVENAVTAAERVGKLLREVGVKHHVQLVEMSVEELCEVITERNKGVHTIDIVIRRKDDVIQIYANDLGKEYFPGKEIYEKAFNGIWIIRKLALKMNYSRILGINCTKIDITE